MKSVCSVNMEIVQSQKDTDVLDKIYVLEDYLKTCLQVELPLFHYFAKGLYAREMRVPAGVMISGMIHSTETVGILSKGKMSIVNDDGSRTDVEAPFIHIGKPGAKRIGYAVEDVVWTTIHRTDLTDLAEIEKEQFILGPGNESMFDFGTGKVRDKELQDTNDFALMLSEHGLSVDEVRAQSVCADDMVDCDLEILGLSVEDSPIEGKGIVSSKFIESGQIIGPALINNHRTQIGRYTNHSCSPNAKMTMTTTGDIYLMAIRDILPGEITTNYRDTLKMLEGVR